MWHLFYSFLLFLSVLSYVHAECFFYSENDPSTNLEPGSSAGDNAGTLLKTLTPADHVPGFILDGYKLSVWETNLNCDEAWFTITQVNDTYISVVVADGFADLVDNYDNYRTDPPKCTISLTWQPTPECNNPINYHKIYYTIEDVNIHPPEFNLPVYDIKVAFPVSSGLSLTDAYKKDIIITDLDFSTKKITCVIDDGSSDLAIIPGAVSGKKHSMGLQALRSFNSLETISLKITATDDGVNGGQMTSKATINIIPDEENSIPPNPDFPQTLIQYNGGIQLQDLEVGYILPIKVENPYPTARLEVVGNDDFKVELDTSATTTYVLEVIKVPDPELTYCLIQIKATLEIGTNSASSYTTVVFDIIRDGSSSTTTSDATTTSTEVITTTPGDDGSTTPKGDVTKPPGHGNDDDDSQSSDSDTGLLAGTIVLAILSACLLGLLGYGYYRCVHKQRVMQPTSAGMPSTSRSSISSATGIPNMAYENEKTSINIDPNEEPVASDEKSLTTENVENGELTVQENTPTENDGETLKPMEEKTRKRSVTFRNDDEESRLNREEASGKFDLSQADSSVVGGENDKETTQL